MRIGIYLPKLPSAGRKLGGVEVFVDRLASALAVMDHDVEVISVSDAPVGTLYRHRQIFPRFPILFENRIFLLFVLPFLLNIVDLSKYDVVHLNGDDWFFFTRIRPSVRTFYGSALWEARSATRLRRRLSLYIVYLLEHISRRLATVAIGVGEEATKIYDTDGIVKLFASAKVFYPGPKTDAPSLIFVGTWEGRKRGKFVAETFLQSILPHAPTAKLFMASNFVPSSPSIVDLKSPSAELLAEALRQSWVLLSGSTYEGFGLPYLEAQMSGTAIVSTRNSGAEYVLESGKSGFIVDDRDFAEAVLGLLENVDLRQRMAEAGLLRAREFAEEEVIKQHLAYYQSAIDKFHYKRGVDV